MTTKLTAARLAELAKELVAEYQAYIHRPENPFDSRKRTSLDDMADKLGKLGLIPCPESKRGRGRLMIRDAVHGSPVMLNSGNELVFCNEKFAKLVRDELKAQRVYSGAQVVKLIE